MVSGPLDGREQKPVGLFIPPDSATTPDHLSRGYSPDAIQRIEVEEWAEWSKLRRKEVRRLLNIFYLVNGAVFLFTFIVWSAEKLFPPPAPDGRIVTEHVLLALIAASAAQLGVLAVAVGRGLIHETRRR
jgi:hypothetical protein